LLDNNFFLIYLLKNSQDTRIKRKREGNPAYRRVGVGKKGSEGGDGEGNKD